MKTAEIKVVFQPAGRSVYVLPGTKVLEAAGRAGLILQSPCGGHGTCGKCVVRIASGPCAENGGRPPALSAERWDEGYRLACQTRVEGPAVVEIPAESLFEHQQQILVSDAGTRAALDPFARKVYFDLPPPTPGDSCCDLARLRCAVGDVELPYDLLRQLPGFLRANGWKGTAVLHGARLTGLEAGNTAATCLGVAFDIGTTTVVGTLFDLTTGRELGVQSRMNPQIAFGDDVLSRILQARRSAAGLADLQRAILETVDEIIGALTRELPGGAQAVYEIAIAGNSTMQQLLCGIDPSALGEVPFVEAFDRALTLSCARLGIRANPAAEAYVFPQIGSFVGGDTVAGMVASRLDRWGTPVLFVDIGTNGEIVLAWNGRLEAASAAAGPAFEGARIGQGMRATTGAIEKILVQDGDLLANVIGNVPPVGLCGTALIDCAAELLRHGIIDETGRILPPEEAPPAAPEGLRQRLVNDRNGDPCFQIATPEETASREPICLTQRDVRELQLATGAIRAAINILLRRAGVTPADLGAVLLAGAFGNFIRRSNARRIGLLPALPRDRIRFIGNAASLGAKLVLLARGERDYAEALRRQCEHVDLSLDPEFQAEFGQAMLFPSREADECG